MAYIFMGVPINVNNSHSSLHITFLCNLSLIHLHLFLRISLFLMALHLHVSHFISLLSIAVCSVFPACMPFRLVYQWRYLHGGGGALPPTRFDPPPAAMGCRAPPSHDLRQACLKSCDGGPLVKCACRVWVGAQRRPKPNMRTSKAAIDHHMEP